MSKTFFCHIDNVSAEVPKHFYPHARYKADPVRYAGKWRFKAPNAKSSTDISNFIDCAPEQIGIQTLIQMSKQLYHKHYPDMLIDDSAVRIDRGSLLYQFNKFKTRYEGNTLRNWNDIESACTRYCEAVGNIPLNKLDQYALQEAFDYFQPNTQKKMRACMAKFFAKHLFKFDLIPKITDNPFREDGRCSLEFKAISDAKTNRLRIKIKEVRSMIAKAQESNEQWLVDALKISFLTGLRCADVMNLKWADYDRKTDELVITIGKSEGMNKNNNSNIRLLISGESHPEVMRIVKKRALNRKVELIPEKTYYGVKQEDAVHETADYVFYRRPERLPRYIPNGKDQYTQLTSNYYSRMFKTMRDQCPDIVQRSIKEKGYVCLHEVRSLFARLSAVKGFELDDIKDALAHQRKGKGALENNYLDGILIKPVCMVTLDDLAGGEIDEKRHRINERELEEAIGAE